ncbi:MAG: isocitrate lyase/PEP mutase family protein [Bacillota bacterium]|jgi:2-methylisocitrate lyase-like PEP mutase family enzyme
MTNAKKLRKVFEEQKIVVIPGAYDAISALLVQEAGFSVAYLGGFSISASMTGYPDWGFTTMNEMLSTAVNVVNILDIPVLCDIDQGFGALTNFVRTVHCYENAGVAAIHFEDQPFPKKCSQQPNRTIISMGDAVAKIKAAVETRNDPDFMLIARTDSKKIEGMDGLKRRMEAYLNAGADYTIFCEHTTEEELVEVGKEFPGRVIAFVGDVADNTACCLPVSSYEEMGYKGLQYCALGLCSAHWQMKKNYETLFKTGHISSEYMKENITSLREIERITKLSTWQALRDKYNML